MGTAAKNNQLLLTELQNLISALDFPHASALANADLNSPEGIKAAAKSAFQLRNALSMDVSAAAWSSSMHDRCLAHTLILKNYRPFQGNIHPALLKMQAVTDQNRRLEKIKIKFSQHLTSHLAKLFIHFGNSISSMDIKSSILAFRLPTLSRMHQDLLRYVELTSWLKLMDSESFGSLLKTYTTSIQKIYERNVKNVFDEARHRISGGTISSRCKIN